MKDVFLFSSRIPLFDIHKFLIRYLAFYSILNCEFVRFLNLDWCYETLKITVRRFEDLKNDFTLKRRNICLFISAILNTFFYKSYKFNPRSNTLPGEISLERNDKFFLKFLHFSPTKISHQKLLPSKHIVPSRS